jgi:hypothetical protein
LTHAKVTVENINTILQDNLGRDELDLPSIDVDGNDYWLWKALSCNRPQVVVIEYNALWRSPLSVAMRYRPEHAWALEANWDASLAALEKLGTDKGYESRRTKNAFIPERHHPTMWRSILGAIHLRKPL